MRLLVIVLLGSIAISVPLLSQPPPSRVEIVGHVLEVAKQPTSGTDGLQVPEGFRISRFADDLGHPRILAVADDGSVYVTRREEGDVLLLRDGDRDGRADAPVVVARRPQMHGIAIDGDTVYLATVHDVYTSRRQRDGTLGSLRRIIDDLPDGGQHPNRTLAIGPDRMLYISVGSTCNACAETGPEHATLLRAAPDGHARTIFAAGLRNTIGFDWHPSSGELWGMDHGIDWLGDDEQKEELNHLQQGRQYGWPYIYADNRHNPQDDPPSRMTMDEWAAMSETPTLLHTAHAAPMQMAFYDGDQFPDEYRGDAFVAMHGSWNREPPSGYQVVRVRFDDQGRPTAFEPFVTGFLVDQGDDRWGYRGRPVGVAVASDGALLVSDDGHGVIYRIAHDGRQP